MKKLLTTLLILFTVSLWSQVSPVMIGATYMSCTDSITNVVRTNMTLTKIPSGSRTDYTFTASNPTETYYVTFTDFNGGNIQAGDSVRITSANYMICGTGYTLRLDVFPTITITVTTVAITYSDCILPLNGTSGTVRMRFTQ